MNFAQEEEGQQQQQQEQEEQEQEQRHEQDEAMISKVLFSSTSSPPSYKHKDFWLGSSSSSSPQQNPLLNFDNKSVELMDLSLATTATNTETDNSPYSSTEKEHMFDKVVTPSDVGKLNRLVIPKQHAEKYFPLGSSSNEKGLLLNFEDRSGKAWRFRYSYWNSSQSYVMTKGWSRFVKEKKLDAGDIVSFQRGVGESGKHRLFIDWRRRPNAATAPNLPGSFIDLQNHHQILNLPQSLKWPAGRLYSLPQYSPLSGPRQFENNSHQFQHLSYTTSTNYSSNYQHHHQNNYQNSYYLRPQVAAHQIGSDYHYHHHHLQHHQHHQQEEQYVPMVIDSVPVVHGKAVGKRLRLFGVNMECCPSQEESSSTTSSGYHHHHHHHHLAQLRAPTSTAPMPTTTTAATTTTTMQEELSKKGKTSLSFDLEL